MGKIYDAMEKSKADRAITKNILSALEKNEAKPGNQNRQGDKTAKSGEKVSSAKIAVARPGRLHQPQLALRKQVRNRPVDKNLITLNDPSSLESEQFRILRTSILFPTSGKPPRTILVTSALPEEGKSFVSANLAVCMAQNINEHVLLIDGDVRKPTLHTTFGFGETPGLAEHLSDGTPLSSLILKTSVKKLSLLPSGTPPHNPSELLSSESMSNLIKETRNRYSDRFIIIDSPPPRLTSETAALARQVDGVIIVIKAGSTPKELTEKLVEMLGKEKILGIVINRSDIQSSKYYGYGKYGKYGGKKG